MSELVDEAAFDKAVRDGVLIVSIDNPTKVVPLHPAPGDCAGLREGFVTKVVENRGKTGSHWRVESESVALQRWGHELAVCRRCGST